MEKARAHIPRAGKEMEKEEDQPSDRPTNRPTKRKYIHISIDTHKRAATLTQ